MRFEPIYKPERSTRGITFISAIIAGWCRACRASIAPTRAPAAVSGGADWGNVRYGKGFRTADRARRASRRHVDLDATIALLDVGSNRGSFARAFLEAAPKANIVAVEPDERVAAFLRRTAAHRTDQARIEDVPLETGRFDIVHSCHTIEHLAHPAHALADHGAC